MRINQPSGVTTLGLTGIVLMSGVIFAGLNPWWLTLSILCIISAIGYESGKV
jgi:hypothetical protein